MAEVQSHNDAKIQEFERNVLGLTHGDGSEADVTQEEDSKWENIQADVQEAMDKDELSVDDPGQGQEAIDDGAEEIESAPDRPEVFEQGPLYASKNAACADDDMTAASAGSEEEDGDREDDDEANGEEEREEEEEDENDDGEVENRGYQEDLEALLEEKASIKANDVGEAEREVGGDDAERTDIAPSGNSQVEVHDDVDLLTQLRNENDTPSETFRQVSVDEATESTDGKEDTSTLSDANTDGIPEEEGQQEFQIQADQRYLDSIDQEAAQANSAARSSSSEDILAMTITLRNKVNGQFVLRPEQMTAADEWSIEYSLSEVTEQPRARALYEACRRRRSKKMEQVVPENAEVINGYIQRLREMSAKGRAWRKEQDKRDTERPVEVL